MRAKATNLAVMLMLCLGGLYCAAQDFSADVLYSATDNPKAGSGVAPMSSHNPSRLYVSKDKIRLETRGPDGAVLVMDRENDGMFVLFPAKKEYELLGGGLSEYFRVADAQNACPDWEKSAAEKIVCEKAGNEIVNGRQAVRYRNKGASDSAISSVWIDQALKFVVKWEGAGTSVELHNIMEGQQPGDLFALPTDYEASKPRKGNNKGFSNR